MVPLQFSCWSHLKSCAMSFLRLDSLEVSSLVSLSTIPGAVDGLILQYIKLQSFIDPFGG